MKFWFSILCLLCLCNVSAAVEESPVNKVFIVENIETCKEANTLENAKREAMYSGAYQAFLVLFKRLLPSNNAWRLDDVSQDMATNALQETVIVDDRATARAYKVKANYIFDEQKVKKILNRLGFYYISKFSDDNLIIPVIIENDQYKIWDDEVWFDAFGDLPTEYGLVRLKGINGDLLDIGSIKPREIYNWDIKTLQPILNRYQSKNVIVVLGERKGSEFVAKVKIWDGDKQKETTFSMPYNFKISENIFYQEVGCKVLQIVDDYYKSYNSL